MLLTPCFTRGRLRHCREAGRRLLLDLWKAYETVLPSILLREGLASGFPPALLVMAIKLYMLPRVLKLFGAFSLPYKSKQGIIAGCSMATSLLRALMFRSLRRISAQFSIISFTAGTGVRKRSTAPLESLAK